VCTYDKCWNDGEPREGKEECVWLEADSECLSTCQGILESEAVPAYCVDFIIERYNCIKSSNCADNGCSDAVPSECNGPGGE